VNIINKKHIIKFNKISDDKVEIIYVDGTKEIINSKQLDKFSLNNYKMAFIMPKKEMCI